jgi:threonyl-tRNA synthetase
LGFKIREAQIQKIPYMLVVGDREEKEGIVSPRHRSGETMKGMKLDDFVSQVESKYPSI